jgi:hypothetical protein
MFGSVKVYIQGISINNFIEAEFDIAKKWTNLFYARRDVLVYKHCTHQKGDLPCLQLSESILIFLTETLYVVPKEMYGNG